MFRNITLQLADGSEKTFGFKACGTTSFRYKMIFGKELLASISAIMNALDAQKLAALIQTSAAAENEGKAEVGLDELDPETLQAVISIVGSGEFDAIGKLAFVMNKQAEGADMSKIDVESYLDWLDQFETMEFLTHAMDFISLYMGNRATTSTPKKGAAQLIEM